ncbi:MAG: glycosyltransferase, partial [Alphaproteobacteria bacterium]
MKVCQLCSIDFVMHHFIQPLAVATAAAGHDVTCVCADGPLLDKVRAAGLRVETAPLARSFDLRAHWRAYRRLRDFFRREKFDLVHVHNPVAALIGRLAAWRAGVPCIVYTAHGFYFHEAMPWPKRALFILLEWLAGRITDVLFTQAEEDAAAARRYRLCRGSTIEAIGNGVDPERFHPPTSTDAARARLRAELDTPAGAPVIVMTGRLVAEKGYPELFEAMRSVEAHLWVAGDRLPSDHAGSIAGEVARIESDPALSSRVRFLGYRADMPDILRAADLFTLPSHREGMPRSIAEEPHPRRKRGVALDTRDFPGDGARV